LAVTGNKIFGILRHRDEDVFNDYNVILVAAGFESFDNFIY